MVYVFASAGLLTATMIQTAATLPPAWLWGAMVVGALAVARTLRGRLRAALLSAMAGAIFIGAWSHWSSMHRLAQRLPASAENITQAFTATLIDLPDYTAERTRILVRLETALPGLPAGSRVLLNEYVRPQQRRNALQAGELWTFSARLKRPHALLNPGTQDREAWLWAHGIRATGTIKMARRLERSTRPEARLAALRAHISQSIQQRLYGRPSAGLIAALVVGDGSAIPREQWALFAATGITHLVSISGLHITLVAGQAAALAALIWSRFSGAALLLPTRRVAVIAGLGAALTYSLLAGFSVPTQRTLFMLAIISIQIFWRQQPVLKSLAWSLSIVLIYDPFSVLTVGLWLSYGAVAIMAIGVHGQVGARAGLAEGMRAQGAVTLGLMPGLIALFGLFPWTSPLANLIAIPVISGMVTPLALLGSVLPGSLPLLWAEQLATTLLPLLEACAALGQWSQAQPPLHWWLLAAAGAVYASLPRGVPGRWLGLVAFLPMILWRASPPEPGEWRATVLDVGQGLAVLVQTHAHTLLYDSGPDWPGEGDSGSVTVLPALRALGADHLNVLLISHDDNDHSGGAASIMDALPPDNLTASLPLHHALWQKQKAARVPCLSGQHWSWDGVKFEIFNPLPNWPAENDNDSSCVLRLSSAHGSLLLPGDISSQREAVLLAQPHRRWQSDVVLAPHHGSKSSSSLAFIDSTRPQLVIFSAGYLNRFRHPHPDTQARYAGVTQYRSDQDGAIRLESGRKGWIVNTEHHRRRRFWRDRGKN